MECITCKYSKSSVVNIDTNMYFSSAMLGECRDPATYSSTPVCGPLSRHSPSIQVVLVSPCWLQPA